MAPDFTLSPKTAVVRPGDTLVWVNDSAALHSVKADTGAPSSLNSATSFPAGMNQGQRYRWVVPITLPAGTYFYHCTFHGSSGNGSGFGGGMVGAIEVR